MRREDPGGSVKWQARDYSAAITQANKAQRHEHTKQKAGFAATYSLSPLAFPGCPAACERAGAHVMDTALHLVHLTKTLAGLQGHLFSILHASLQSFIQAAC